MFYNISVFSQIYSKKLIYQYCFSTSQLQKMHNNKSMLCLFLLFACLALCSNAQQCPTASGFTFYPHTADNRLYIDNLYSIAYGGIGVVYDGGFPGCCVASNTGCAGNSTAICRSYGFNSGLCYTFGAGISGLTALLSSVLGAAGDLLFCCGCTGK